jgi:zinc/manganese transport system permease protein
MNDILTLLWPPFAVSLCLVGIHTYFGIQVLNRGIIFIDLALAQIAALGATFAFIVGHPVQGPASYGYSLAATLGAAVFLSFTRRWGKRIPQEALIGVVYVTAASASLLMIDSAPQGAEHLKQILTGNILTTGLPQLAFVIPLYAVIGGLHWVFRSRLGSASGKEAWIWEFLFYATFGIVVTSSVALGGVLLVFAFLIIPACIGFLYSRRPGRQLLVGWAAGVAASLAGLTASYVLDLPTGATMVCAFGISLAFAGVLHPFLTSGMSRLTIVRFFKTLRWSVAIALLVSAVWLFIAPRSDQPLLDAAEMAVPQLRELYMDNRSKAIFEDSREHAERYRLAAERLLETERKRRWEGTALDDHELMVNSSFQKTYGEMLRGEIFVMREIIGRARESTRWQAGGLIICVGLLLFPGLLRRVLVRGRAGLRAIRPSAVRRKEASV